MRETVLVVVLVLILGLVAVEGRGATSFRGYGDAAAAHAAAARVRARVKQMAGGGGAGAAVGDAQLWFASADADRNGHLDGLEMLAALASDAAATVSLADLDGIVDGILARADSDNDGRVSWSEYLANPPDALQS
ncbi:hypothetical protein HK100_006298 [Physocladia obscura]|uniref:EF-hand domain-containing protein n=1 Tax=Physocladia obscura TaxID=109957 RepID=A0AAD5XCQ3_9FUNG|nr:hypothetical protein HK100_006298 [Physocladia obscura]